MHARLIDQGEPLLIGDRSLNLVDIANEQRQRAYKGTRTPFGSAAPSTTQAELYLRIALDKCENSAANQILVINLSSEMSAQHRNMVEAVKRLPQEAQERITVYDSGYVSVTYFVMTLSNLVLPVVLHNTINL